MLMFKYYPCLFALCLFACQPTENNESQGEATKYEDEWLALLDGTNLDGWQTIGIAEAEVDNGELVLSGSSGTEGWLVSDIKPGNFILKTEFKLSPTASSGLAIRYPSQDGGSPTYCGYEINLDNRPDVQNPTGTIISVGRAFWQSDIDPDGWNKLQIEAQGEHLQVKVNGIKVAETFARRSMQGAVALQAPEGGEQPTVRFRDMQLKATKPTALSQPPLSDYMRSLSGRKSSYIFDGETNEGWYQRGDARWTIEGGVISGNSEGTAGGFLCTKQDFENFYLRLNFKIALEDNSGIFIRHSRQAPEVTLDEGLEVNVYDVDFSWAHPTGSVNNHARAFAGTITYDDWNLMEIFAFDERVSVYVNGLKASDGTVPPAYQRAGEICLQVYPRVATDEGPSRVFYKNIALKNLDGIPAVGH